MKRLLLLSLLIVLMLSLLVSCDLINGNVNEGSGDEKGEGASYTYTAFTASEKAKLVELIGEVFPFISNNEYYFETVFEGKVECINFYTLGNTKAEFDDYRDEFSDYTLTDTTTNEDGDTEYHYAKGDIRIRISYNLISVNVLVYLEGASDDNTDDGDNQGGNQGGSEGGSEDDADGFTESEKAMFISYVGEVIPYLIADTYYIDDYRDTSDACINYYTYGNTQVQFDLYRAKLVLAGYTLSDTMVDDYGDTWYFYDKGEIYLDIAYYETEDGYVVDIYVYPADDAGSGDDIGGNEGGDNAGDYIYTDFTTDEKNLLTSYIGEVIPFLPSNEYYVDDYTTYSDPFISFYTYNNTAADFNAYRAALVAAGYVHTDTMVDDYGDTWYYYDKGDIYIDVAYYATEDGYVVDVYVYLASDTGNGDDDFGGNQGGTDYPDDSGVITNNGAGLPSDADGVYDVDFTDAANVKDVTDQGYYIDGCPTVGSPNVLVIPVEFSDVTAASRGYDIAKLYTAFSSNNPNDGIYSVYEYYKISSYGKLTVDFTIVDNWFKPKYNSAYYASSTDSDGYANGDQLVIDEALAYLSTIMDLSEFDSDDNGVIDAVVIVHTLDIDETKDFYWAYRYWNYHVDGDGYYYEYDGVSANDYLWASFDFLHEEYDANGNINYNNDSGINTYTYIHEFGHILGADDYYDTSGKTEGPLLGMDVMDGMLGDHNAFTKFNFGWLTESRLVVCEGSITLTLEAFAKNGDTIIIANNWDDKLGAYQEYYIIVYYTAEGLNAGEDAGYFVRDGIVVYHVNASLYSEVYDGETYYDVYNNNTDPSDEYGSENNLIEYVVSAGGTYTYVVGDTMEKTYDDAGDALVYNFVVDSIGADTATLTFTRK